MSKRCGFMVGAGVDKMVEIDDKRAFDVAQVKFQRWNAALRIHEESTS